MGKTTAQIQEEMKQAQKESAEKQKKLQQALIDAQRVEAEKKDAAAKKELADEFKVKQARDLEVKKYDLKVQKELDIACRILRHSQKDINLNEPIAAPRPEKPGEEFSPKSEGVLKEFSTIKLMTYIKTLLGKNSETADVIKKFSTLDDKEGIIDALKNSLIINDIVATLVNMAKDKFSPEEQEDAFIKMKSFVGLAYLPKDILYSETKYSNSSFSSDNENPSVAPVLAHKDIYNPNPSAKAIPETELQKLNMHRTKYENEKLISTDAFLIPTDDMRALKELNAFKKSIEALGKMNNAVVPLRGAVAKLRDFLDQYNTDYRTKDYNGQAVSLRENAWLDQLFPDKILREQINLALSSESDLISQTKAKLNLNPPKPIILPTAAPPPPSQSSKPKIPGFNADQDSGAGSSDSDDDEPKKLTIASRKPPPPPPGTQLPKPGSR